MEITYELFQDIAKRAWKLAWVLVLNIILSIGVLAYLIIEFELYHTKNIMVLNKNVAALIGGVSENLFFSSVLLIAFYILGGNNEFKLKKLRGDFYKRVEDKIRTDFIYRFNFPEKHIYDPDVYELIERNKFFVKKYKNEAKKHTLAIDHLKSSVVLGVDSFFIVYAVDKIERVRFNVWHAGSFIAIKIALDRHVLDDSKQNVIEQVFEKRLNLAGSLKEEDKPRLSVEDTHWWFTIKYATSGEFLFNNSEQDKVIRNISHIITSGVPAALEILDWKHDNSLKIKS